MGFFSYVWVLHTKGYPCYLVGMNTKRKPFAIYQRDTITAAARSIKVAACRAVISRELAPLFDYDRDGDLIAEVLTRYTEDEWQDLERRASISPLSSETRQLLTDSLLANHTAAYVDPFEGL